MLAMIPPSLTRRTLAHVVGGAGGMNTDGSIFTVMLLTQRSARRTNTRVYRRSYLTVATCVALATQTLVAVDAVFARRSVLTYV